MAFRYGPGPSLESRDLRPLQGYARPVRGFEYEGRIFDRDRDHGGREGKGERYDRGVDDRRRLPRSRSPPMRRVERDRPRSPAGYRLDREPLHRSPVRPRTDYLEQRESIMDRPLRGREPLKRSPPQRGDRFERYKGEDRPTGFSDHRISPPPPQSYGAARNGHGFSSGPVGYGSGGHSFGSRSPPTEIPRSCYICGSVGHLARECPSGGRDGKAPYLGSKEDHGGGSMASTLGAGRPRNYGRIVEEVHPSEMAVPRCYECGKKGHVARECRLKPQQHTGPPPPHHPRSHAHDIPRHSSSSRGGGLGGEGGGGLPADLCCYTCGSPGHLARDCPRDRERVRDDSRDRGPALRQHHSHPRQNSEPRGSRRGPEPSYGYHQAPHPHHHTLSSRVLGAPPPPPHGSASAASSTCYNCGKPGHFARECPSKYAASGGAPVGSRWAGGEGRRPSGFSNSPHGRGGRGPNVEPGGGPEAEGCYECGQQGHFARECPMRSQKPGERGGAPGGSKFSSVVEGRKSVAIGGGREESKLNDDLENYMKERASHRRNSDDDGNVRERSEERKDIGSDIIGTGNEDELLEVDAEDTGIGEDSKGLPNLNDTAVDIDDVAPTDEKIELETVTASAGDETDSKSGGPRGEDEELVNIDC